MKTFHNLIETHEAWLTESVLEKARAHGYTSDSSTLEQSWRASICGLSEPMIEMLEQGQWPSKVSYGCPIEENPLVAFSAAEAHLHRQRGVPLDQYMGLIKYYREAYLDLIEMHVAQGEAADRYRRFIHLFFDQIEIGICAEWDAQSESGALQSAAETNRQLINEKNRYLTIFESLNEPVIILGDDQQIINLNVAANKLFDDQAVTGQAYYTVSETPPLNPQIIAMMETVEGESELEYELETVRGKRTFQVKIQRMLDVSEKFTGTVVILLDITDFREAQYAAEAADRAKDAFLATMSHEIRTPINGILGTAHLLRDAPASARRDDYLDALLSSGELLLDLVNDMLDYTKLEAGESKVEAVVFSPRDMVERLARLSMGEAERKGLRLILDVADNCPPAVLADNGKIQRILLNLINNAVKFTRQGTVEIGLQARVDGLVFTVRDTGPGIPQSDHERVFAPFFQSITPGVEPTVGTGLGLSICARLADLIGAELSFETPADGGTLFRLDCPATHTETSLQDITIKTDALRILLVEDNPINAMVIEGFLSSDGHRIDAVTSGEAGLELLNEKSYDLVLMDIRLQGADGFEIIRQIRASANPSGATVPILVLTADQSDAMARRFAQSDANAIQAKPLSRDELRHAIGRVMATSQTPLADAPMLQSDPNRSAPHSVVLDDDVIAGHRKAVGEARADRIVAAFCATANQHKTALRAAAQAQNSIEVADIAHGLRSAAHTVGVIRLGELAGATEQALRGDTVAVDLVEKAEALCSEIDVALAALRDHAVPA